MLGVLARENRDENVGWEGEKGRMKKLNLLWWLKETLCNDSPRSALHSGSVLIVCITFFTVFG